ncbi:MAG TPA: hypothetical protein PKD32_10210 [Saprospiraceae bacterium]|nr:hypothetical protein [Saprospiraceae bacterium]
MKLIKISIIVILYTMTEKLYACDACGCSIHNSEIGLITDFKKNYFKMSFSRFGFYSFSETSKGSTDFFNRGNLSFRLGLGKMKKIHLVMQIPYLLNSRKGQEGYQSVKGISDVNGSLYYELIPNKCLGSTGSLYFEFGAGVSAPTGYYNAHIHDVNLPENFNIGKGTFYFNTQTNLVFRWKQSGFVWSNFFQWLPESKDNYQFGSSLNTQLTVFHEFGLNKVKFNPNTGVYLESVAKDVFPSGLNVVESGGRSVFWSFGANIKFSKWIAGFNLSKPLVNSYANESVQAKLRWTSQLSFNF